MDLVANWEDLLNSPLSHNSLETEMPSHQTSSNPSTDHDIFRISPDIPQPEVVEPILFSCGNLKTLLLPEPILDQVQQQQQQPTRQSARKKIRARGKKRSRDEIDRDELRLEELRSRTSLSEEEKNELRILRNRHTARKSREKKRRKMQTAQQEVDMLKRQIRDLENRHKQEIREKDLIIAQKDQIIASFQNTPAPRTTKAYSFLGFVFIIVVIIALSTRAETPHHRRDHVTRVGLATMAKTTSLPPPAVRHSPNHPQCPIVESDQCPAISLDEYLDAYGLNTTDLVEDLPTTQVTVPPAMLKHFPGIPSDTHEAIIYNGPMDNNTIYLFSPFLYQMNEVKPSDSQVIHPKFVIVHPVEVLQNNTQEKLYRLNTLEADHLNFKDASFFSIFKKQNPLAPHETATM